MSPIEKVTGHFKSFDGTPVYFESRGTGKPIVFAYGIVCTTNHWRHQTKFFSHGYQTILFDYRGHHDTPVPSDRVNLSIDGIAQDAKALLQHLGLEKAAFVGHSFGSQVLVRTFDMFPEIFENLTLINGFVTDPLKNMFGTEGVSSAFLMLKDLHERLPETSAYIWKKIIMNPLSMWTTALMGGFNIQLTSFKDIEIYARGVANIKVDVFIEMFNQMTAYDGRPVLDRINVPTLIIGGTKDRVTPLSHQRNLHNRIPGSELITIPYGTHCTQLDMPEFVNLSIERFLRKHNY